ncbi:unnamed protein product [Nesidiocoris tenuis]|uniref:Uncharacterized protein n=1 Tax=Nesidiocoris tenuis TaxID=355587 RepID=A0A6H5H207_9HEMI|nr:unnamed protein product [Nesidiocoris tenuis]
MDLWILLFFSRLPIRRRLPNRKVSPGRWPGPSPNDRLTYTATRTTTKMKTTRTTSGRNSTRKPHRLRRLFRRPRRLTPSPRPYLFTRAPITPRLSTTST